MTKLSAVLKSYILIAWRNLLRNRVTSVIHILGLMLGLTSGILISLVLLNMINWNRFHKNYANIQRLELNQTVNGNIFTGSTTPAPLAPALLAAYPGIRYAVRTIGSQSLVRFGDKALYQQGLYTEPDFFKLMTFPALEGNPAATLGNPNSIVLTQSAALRLFGKIDALGQTLVLDNSRPMKVGAVIRDVPGASTIQFDIVLPFALWAANDSTVRRWDYTYTQTWILLKPGGQLAVLNQLATHLVTENKTANKPSVFAFPLKNEMLYGNFQNGKDGPGKIYIVILMGLLAALVLLVACFNFINISTALAERRAREVGLRKTLGATRKLIILQFLGEAMLIAMLAVSLSALLAWALTPVISVFSEIQIGVLFANWRFWVLLLVMGLFTGLVAGSYPAFYLSRFLPVQVLRGHAGVVRKPSRMRSALVTFQFAVSAFFIAGVMFLTTQMNYVRDRPIGYEMEHLVDISANGALMEKFDLFKSKAKEIPGVLDVTSGMNSPIGIGGYWTWFDWPGKKPDQNFIIYATRINYDWIATTGVSLLEGRDFDPGYGRDSLSCLLNQAAVARLGLHSPVVGSRLGNMTVIGVVRDFVFNTFNTEVHPLILTYGNHADHILVRLAADDHAQAKIDRIRQLFKSLNPGYPFEQHFVREEWERLFRNDDRGFQLIDILGLTAVLISCMGLFGLASFIVERRTKEISIRKVLGMPPIALWTSLLKEFLGPVFIGLLIGLPVAVLLMAKLLTLIVYHLPLSAGMLLIAVASAVAIAMVTVTYHGIRASRINPVEALRSE